MLACFGHGMYKSIKQQFRGLVCTVTFNVYLFTIAVIIHEYKLRRLLLLSHYHFRLCKELLRNKVQGFVFEIALQSKFHNFFALGDIGTVLDNLEAVGCIILVETFSHVDCVLILRHVALQYCLTA